MGINPSTYQSLLEDYGLDSKKLTIEELSQGLINDTYVLLEDNTPVYLLQRINTAVFKNADAILNNQQRALSVLRKSNSNYPELKSTVDHQSFLQDQDQHYWRLTDFVKNSKAYDSSKDSSMAYEAGKLLAEFHNSLKNENLEDYQTHLPKFNDLEFRFEEFDKAFHLGSKERIQEADEELALVDLLKPLLLHHKFNIPLRVCHNDTKLNNMLFSNEKAICLIDLDTLMPGYLFYDFGDLFRTAAFSAKEGELNLDQIKLNKDYTKSLIQGFCSTIENTSKEELKSLSLGAVYMPFIHGLRALTDYFLNDQYYKVNNPTENLDRAKSLFRFAKEAHKNNAFIDKCIKEFSSIPLV